MLIRTWNVFHGRTVPPTRMRRPERMVRLACEDEPAVVVLQELAAAWLGRLADWSGYHAFGDVALRPRLPRRLGERLTDIDPNLLRSAVEGQANAILLHRDLRGSDHTALVLNPRRFRERVAESLALGLRARLAWAKERRVVQAVRVRLRDGRSTLVANLHATSYGPDKRIADAELLRAATFADGLAEPGEPVVLAGDFNVTVVTSPVLRALSGPEWGFSAAGPGLDHVLVRGLEVVRAELRWPDVRRRHEGVLLSDHAPVELEVR